MIRAFAGSRLVRLFSSAVIDQALLSAANFAAGLLLIRHTTDEDYGHYVLAFSALLLMMSLQSALLSGPVAVIAPKRSLEDRRQLISVLMTVQRWVVLRGAAAGLLLVTGLWLAGWMSAATAVVWAAFALTAWSALKREFVRNGLLIYARPHVVLMADAVYSGVLVCLVAAAAFTVKPAAPAAVLALGLAAIVGTWPANRSFARDPGWVTQPVITTRQALAEIIPLGSWAAGGAAVYWAFSQGYNYVLAAKLDLAAVAGVAATRLLLMPVNLLTGGVKQLLLPMAAGWHEQSGVQALLRRLGLFVVLMVSFAALYCGLLWLTRDWLVSTILKKTIADRDRLILLWSAIFLLSMVRDLWMVALLVRERFRSMTWLTLGCAVLSLTVSTWGMTHYGAYGALYGLLAGEITNLLGVIVLLWRDVRRPVAGAMPSPRAPA